MSEDHYYHRMFALLPSLSLEKGAKARILAEIARLERRVTIARRTSFVVAVGTFFAAMIPATDYLLTEFASSSFFSYASLLLSDSDIALAHGQELFLTLIESLPLPAITLVLALVVLLLGTIRLIGTRARDVVEYASERFA